MTTTTHTAGRWTQCPACMEKDRMLGTAAENYRGRIVDHAKATPLEREREDVAFARYRLAFHEWEQSIADHHAANGEATEEAETAVQVAEPAETAEPTPQERAEYFAARDQADPDDEREECRRAAKEIIAAYMGVPVEDVRIICSGVFGDDQGGRR